MFSFSRRRNYFIEDEKQRIVEAIRHAEKQTSGEVRVFVESRCRYVDPLDRAAEVFWGLQMDRTAARNGVLVYVAMRDHQYAVFADDGIHKKVGEEFWRKEVESMRHHFLESRYGEAIASVVEDIGNALREHFPYEDANDKNELPDDIVFGD